MKKQTVQINNIEYALADLSAEAKKQIMNLKVTDEEIGRLQAQLAIAKTARAAYARALDQVLPAADGAASTPKAQSKLN